MRLTLGGPVSRRVTGWQRQAQPEFPGSSCHTSLRASAGLDVEQTREGPGGQNTLNFGVSALPSTTSTPSALLLLLLKTHWGRAALLLNRSRGDTTFQTEALPPTSLGAKHAFVHSPCSTTGQPGANLVGGRVLHSAPWRTSNIRSTQKAFTVQRLKEEISPTWARSAWQGHTAKKERPETKANRAQAGDDGTVEAGFLPPRGNTQLAARWRAQQGRNNRAFSLLQQLGTHPGGRELRSPMLTLH